MFYKVSAPHVSFKEFAYEGNFLTKPIVLVIGAIVKLLRIPLPSSTDIPPVDLLRDFCTTVDKIPSEIIDAIQSVDPNLQEQGFTCGHLIGLSDVEHNTRYGSSVYRSQSGDTIAWVRYRLWPNLEKKQKFARVAFYSLGHNGEVILTTSATRDLLDPPTWKVQYHPRCEIAKLVELHREHVASVLGNAQPLIAEDAESALNLLDHTHQEFIEFQVERGVFKPIAEKKNASATSPKKNELNANAPDVSPAAAVTPTVIDDQEGEPVYAADVVLEPTDDYADLQPIIEAVRKQENKQSGWITKLILLVISIVVFVGLGAFNWGWEIVLLSVPVLLVHELGHLIAMKLFGYKNIHMFFIPLLGAAVSGRKYRVESWKKAAVALAGPVPSILLSFPLTFAGYYFQSDMCLQAAMITLIINLLNLAPFMPLDGGQVAHLTLFSRSNVLDLVCRIGTALLMLGVAILIGAKIMIGFSVVLIIGLPTVWKTTQATERVRKRELPPPEDDQMSPEAIRTVVDEIQSSGIQAATTNVMAQMALNVYENVVTKPPSWPATIGIWATYVGSIFLGIVGLLAVGFASLGGGWWNEDFGPDYEYRYHEVNLAVDGQFRMGKVDVTDENKKTDLLIWKFADSDLAKAAFDQLKESGNDTASRLGNVVFTSLPSKDYDQVNLIEDQYERGAEVERLANEDERLNTVKGEDWRRGFHNKIDQLPEIIAICESESADAIVKSLRSSPRMIGTYTPIAAWTPKLKLTDTQRETQKTLMILQGVFEQAPWEVDSDEPDWGDGELESEDDFQAFAKRMADRAEKMQKARREWIVKKSESTEGVEQQICKIFLELDEQNKRWREELDKPGPTPDPPNLNKMLDPLLDQLGYLTPENPLVGTSAIVGAYDITEDIRSDQETGEGFGHKEFPLPLEGLSALELNVYPTQDAAAAYASVLAWLKNQGVRTVVFSYDAIVPEEETE